MLYPVELRGQTCEISTLGRHRLQRFGMFDNVFDKSAPHARQRAGLAFRAIQQTRDKVPRLAFEVDCLDRVIAAIDAAMDYGVQRSLRWHRPQP